MGGLVVTIAAGTGASLVSAAYIVVAIRSLEPSDWAISAVLLNSGILIGSVLNFGSSLYQVRLMSTMPDAAAKLEFRSQMGTRVAIAVVVVALAALASAFLQSPFIMSTVGVGVGYLVSLGAYTYLLSRKRFLAVGLLSISEKVLTLTGLAAIAPTGNVNVFTIPTLQTSSLAIIAIIAFVMSRTPRPRAVWRVSRRDVGAFWLSSRHFGLASLGPSLLQLDVPIVTLMSNAFQAAMFSVGSKLVAPLGVLGNSIATVILPYASSGRITMPGKPILWKLWIAVAGALALLGTVAGTAQLWVPIAFGQEYSQAVHPVQLYVIAVSLGLFARPAATILQAQGAERFVSRAILIQILGALLIIAAGAYFWGATGAALGLCSTNAVLTVVLWVRLVHLLRGAGDGSRPEEGIL